MAEITAMGNGTNKENIEDMEAFIVESEAECGAKDTKFSYRKGLAANASKLEQIKKHHREIGSPILCVGEWIHIFSFFGILDSYAINELDKSQMCESAEDFSLLASALPGEGAVLIRADPVTRMCFNPACSVESTGMTVCDQCYSPYCSVICQESHLQDHWEICSAFQTIVNREPGPGAGVGVNNSSSLKKGVHVKKGKNSSETDWLSKNLAGMVIKEINAGVDRPDDVHAEGEVANEPKIKQNKENHDKAKPGSAQRAQWKSKQKKTRKKNLF